jgi:hypothetical protein
VWRPNGSYVPRKSVPEGLKPVARCPMRISDYPLMREIRSYSEQSATRSAQDDGFVVGKTPDGLRHRRFCRRQRGPSLEDERMIMWYRPLVLLPAQLTCVSSAEPPGTSPNVRWPNQVVSISHRDAPVENESGHRWCRVPAESGLLLLPVRPL